jgi:hypothetical protein
MHDCREIFLYVHLVVDCRSVVPTGGVPLSSIMKHFHLDCLCVVHTDWMIIKPTVLFKVIRSILEKLLRHQTQEISSCPGHQKSSQEEQPARVIKKDHLSDKSKYQSHKQASTNFKAENLQIAHLQVYKTNSPSTHSSPLSSLSSSSTSSGSVSSASSSGTAESLSALTL